MATDPALAADIIDHKIAYYALLCQMSEAARTEDHEAVRVLNNQTSALVVELCALVRERDAGRWAIRPRVAPATVKEGHSPFGTMLVRAAKEQRK
jgi:hypothetical protein